MVRGKRKESVFLVSLRDASDVTVGKLRLGHESESESADDRRLRSSFSLSILISELFNFPENGGSF